MGRNQYWAGRVYDLCVYYMTGTTEGSTESGFMEKPGIEPATPGLQGIALIHYTTARRFNDDIHSNTLNNSILIIMYIFCFHDNTLKYNKFYIMYYSKTCVKRPLKNRQNKERS